MNIRSTPEIDDSAIAVIDLGGQYCHLIGRRLRDIGVHSEIFDSQVSSNDVAKFAGIILSGGPQSVYGKRAPTIDPSILDLGRPVLGICYGHQLLAKMKGSKVAKGRPEYGESMLTLKKGDCLFAGTPPQQTVWMSHGDSILELSPGMEPLAKTETCEIAAYGDLSRKLFGVQFHPEVGHTQFGSQVLENFSLDICGIRKQRHSAGRVERLLEGIRRRAAGRSVFFFVSGGVDSTVAFALCAQALGRERVLGVYVDTGLMRKNETVELSSLLSSAGLQDRLKVRDESGRFLAALEGETDPEKKRHIIGRLFVKVQSDAMREYGIDGEHWLLGQGTIYPDTVESGGTNAATALIKTHHNRCEEVRTLMAGGRVIEPLSEYYKDEVRSIGKEIGLADKLTGRWPFPGPGLAIRCLGRRGQRQAVQVDREVAAQFKGYEGFRFPIRSVGVQGDGRTYREALALRGPLVYDRLADLSSKICNSNRRYNRVIVEIKNKGDLRAGFVIPATLNSARIEKLREADHIVKTIMEEHDLTNQVWQFPTILIPVSFVGGEGETVVLRPVNSEDGMTASFGRLPEVAIREIAERICQSPLIDAVFLDTTNKPPATIEWE